jgi:hypothetical protein
MPPSLPSALLSLHQYIYPCAARTNTRTNTRAHAYTEIFGELDANDGLDAKMSSIVQELEAAPIPARRAHLFSGAPY